MFLENEWKMVVFRDWVKFGVVEEILFFKGDEKWVR